MWLAMSLLCVSTWASATSSVWRVQKDGKEIIIAGSIHALKPSRLPLPIEYHNAMAEVSRVVFEVDIESAMKPEASEYLLQPFRLPNTIRLQQTLKPAVWARWQNKLAEKQLPANLFEEFDAAMASVLLPLTILSLDGYEDGIDSLLYEEAVTAGKTTLELESQAVQRQALETLKDIDGSLLIDQMLTDLDDPHKDISILVRAVYEGDVDTLAPFLEDMRQPVFAAFYEALLTARNRAWVPKIEQWLQESDLEPTLVVVGALHLVGSDSVLAMLEAKGYQVSYY